MPDWIVDLFDKLVVLFGAGGAFAVVLLGVALWWIKNRSDKIDELQGALVAAAKAHAEALAAKETECVAEKKAYKDDLDAQLKRQTDLFMARDEHKRADVIKCFDKLDDFIERVVAALAAVEKTLVNVQIQLAKAGG